MLSRTACALSVSLLSILIVLSPVHCDAVVQDPMQAQANSFGWLAIRNFTYCLSSNPDPPSKPRGVQPGAGMLTNSTATKALTGMGDSVVVVYHPENTNKAIAWCNSLVAFQSTEHVKCHVALPTCQRCDAVRTGSKRETTARQVNTVMGNKAPSGKLGQPRSNNKLVLPNEESLVALQKRAAGESDPNDPLIKSPASTDAKQPPLEQQLQPQFGPSAGAQPKPATEHTLDSSVTVDEDASNDPQLEAAISEFQDYCENKLTLAVRADCPLHVVKSWTDEPPFDLHRFCMSLRGMDAHTLHVASDPNSGSVEPGSTSSGTNVQQGSDAQKGIGKGAVAEGKANAAQTGIDQKPSSSTGKVGASLTGEGVTDPDDPVVPFPFPNAGQSTTPSQPNH